MDMFFRAGSARVWLLSVLVLGTAYALVGRLALLLAIPPGYATAIFPSAGIAVAAMLIWGNRLWPGVFLGSVLLNCWVSLEQGPLSTVVMQVSLGAASGATLQALAGAWLVRRVLGYPITQSREKEIFRFMLLAGPVACLVNASFGATSLYASGVIGVAEYGYSWFTWWVGDVIGVLIAAPLMHIAFAQPRSLWWGRRHSVAVPLLLSLVAVISLFVWVSRWELERTELEFRKAASEAAENLRASVGRHLDSVASIERFFVSSSRVTRSEFATFVDRMLREKPGIQGLGWNPRVSDVQRQDFESLIRAEGFPGFEITERGEEGAMVRAARRPDYVVVTYLEPLGDNSKALGFDVASSADRREALNRARDTGLAVATAPVTLVQESSSQAGVLLFHPVYQGIAQTVEQRRRSLAGYAVGVFRVGDIMDAVVRTSLSDGIGLSISDASAVPGKSWLYGANESEQYAEAPYRWSADLEVGGRRWVLQFWPSPGYLSGHRGWQAWGVLTAGLLFTSVLGAFLLAMTGRAFEVGVLVHRRTAELSGILNTAIETIMTLDDQGRVESVNPAGEALFGRPAEALLGQLISEVVPEFFVSLVAGGGGLRTLSDAGSRCDTWARRLDGGRVPIELALSPLPVGERMRYTLIIHDLTERHKVNRMKDEFISTVNHELRTPLTSIKGALGLVVGGVLDAHPDKKASALALSYDNCQRLEVLINDLLDIGKIQYAEAQLQLQPLLLDALVDKALAMNQGYADKFEVRLRAVAAPEGAAVLGDENRLLQVLSNLLSNACKYSPTQGEVVVSVEPRQGQWRISVADSGPGIPVEFQAQVFERFTQADSSDTRRLGGTGLGLAITRALVERHGGRISFDSLPGEGAVFHVDLPGARPQDGDAVVKAAGTVVPEAP
ncbi:CHASE domain-containing protein [Marinobacterium rhizophilum]|uniref:histidine kinase n=1 Tax=Marinobacterium rhizophilum TaxID=420402 RepID=A0ABY5HQ14_9GAMM|nr:CHASE domain-containing protein [Marinobacterium rhizophilum]UTW13653.1 CHASE domain-containing protein [Marinobacterium rhizophilum]